MSKAIIYQMLPRLWGEGRMSSVDDATLLYLKGLGVSHLWCTGIIRHSTGQPFVKGDAGSPYAISDYYDVNPYLASEPSQRMSEFDALLSRVHSFGLKFIIDFVPNHVGCDYSDSYGGIPLCGWHDYDWSDTVKIDYYAPGTWDAMYRIVRYWAGRGVDGFRCDMVELVPPDFLKWLIARIKEEFPSVVFIAEVYQKEKYRMYIDDVRFDYLYDKSGLYDVLRAIAASSGSACSAAAGAGAVGDCADRLGLPGQGTARAITWNWQFLQDLQPHMLNFLENHDEQRLASPWFAGRADCYALLCASLMLNTAPFMLYFGQETGVDASEGHEGRTSIFNFAKPASLQRLYAFVHNPACSIAAFTAPSSPDSTVPTQASFSASSTPASVSGGPTAPVSPDSMVPTASSLGASSTPASVSGDPTAPSSPDSTVPTQASFSTSSTPASVSGGPTAPASPDSTVPTQASFSTSSTPASADHGAGESISAGELSVLSRYRAALALAGSAAVCEGLTFDLCYCQSAADGFDADRHFAFLRHSGSETILFCCNFAPREARLTLRIPQHAVDYLGLGAQPCPGGIALTVAPFGFTAIPF